MKKILTLCLLVSLTMLTSCSPLLSTETSNTDSSTTTTPAKTLFTTDLADVCNGVAIPMATAYDSAAGIHPILLFGRNDTNDSYSEKSSILPKTWQLEWTEASKYQLVACVTTTPKEMSGTCDFSEEGYTLNNYSADFAVELRKATTGELIDSTTLSLDADKCPTMHFFSEKVENNYPSYEQPLTEFLTKFVQL